MDENQANSREEAAFWQFSDQIRLQTANCYNLFGDSIWSESHVKNLVDRRNFDVLTETSADVLSSQKLAFGSTNRFNYSNDGESDVESNLVEKGPVKLNDNFVLYARKNKSLIGGDFNSVGIGGDKRFKTLPLSESLPRNEAIGGYIFVCNNDTMQENLKRQLFGLPPRYRDSVRAITPGLPLFLYNYSNHQLHGIFEAASFGGTNIDPTAWEDKKRPGESRFPAQVKVVTRKICDPLEEDAFRPILHHYDGPKFRLELNVEEALKLLDIFAFNDA